MNAVAVKEKTKPEGTPVPEENGNKKLKPSVSFILPLFVWATLFYWELVLVIGRGGAISPSLLLYAAVFAIPAAGILCLLSTITRSQRANTAVLAVLLLLTAVFFGVEHFCRAFFTHYMSIGSILSGAGGVVTDFFDVIIRLVLITLSTISWSIISPFLLILIIQLRVSLSSFSLREHIPLESLWGSMGRTLSQRYTLVPLLRASRSRAESSCT